MAKKKDKAVEVKMDVIGSEDAVMSKLNEGRIKAAEENLANAKKRLSTKVYAVKFESEDQINSLVHFMENDAEWKEKESLGVIEICKVLEDIMENEGTKDNIIYLQSLPLQASHYFISKTSGKGLKEAKAFISLLKPFEQGLESAKADAREIEELEKELAAAQQGLEMA